MKVLMDAHWWANGPVSGRVVVRQILSTWAADYPQDDIVAAAPIAARNSIESLGAPNIRYSRTRLRPHGLSNIIEISLLAKRIMPDVVLTQNFASLRGNTAVFVHDLLPRVHPEWFTLPERLYMSGIPLLLPHAKTVLTSSRTEANRIGSLVRRANSPQATGLGVSKDLLASSGSRPAHLSSVESYVLTVGRINIRKNLAFTIDAAIKSGTLNSMNPLVVVGEREGRNVSLSSDAKEAIEKRHILLLGSVPDSELAWLYRNCRLFLYMSLDEGYGLPPLEASALGASVIASDIPVFRETLEGSSHVVFVPPNDKQYLIEELRAQRWKSLERAPNKVGGWSDCVARIRDCLSAAMSKVAEEVKSPTSVDTMRKES